MNKISILYVDDEMNNLISFKAAFRLKYNVLTAISAEEAVETSTHQYGKYHYYRSENASNDRCNEFLE
jgi:response regulator RpfG family c-di-GMP phosphodiesterase